MLMLLAALQMVPSEPQEAARIDGASAVQLFWHVRLPYIRPTLVVAALFRLIDSIKAFPLIYVLTDGGPGAGDRGHQLLCVRANLQFLLLGLRQRGRDADGGRRVLLLSWSSTGWAAEAIDE